MINRDITVAVGLSGGVDSSVAAYLLKKKGYEVTGITMKIWDGSFRLAEGAKNACFGPDEEEDISAAENICREFNIPFHVIDLKDEYRKTVLDYFRKEYLAGRTPNPCVRCNREMKFGFMLKKARERGVEFDYFATGHYARIEKNSEGRYLLKKSLDPTKDQSYFLSGLERSQLEHILFPLGGYSKEQIREIAREIDLEVADKRESQDFISGGDYSPLFSDKDSTPGDIVDTRGNILGKHKGIIHYTVGQRRGLGISSPEPLYVLEIDPECNKIVAGPRKGLYSCGLIAENINLISTDSIIDNTKAAVKIRQMHKEASAAIYNEGERLRIIFDEPQLSVTPGQAVVIYDGDVVLGGGIILKAINTGES